MGVPIPAGLDGHSMVTLMRGLADPPKLAYGGSATKVGPRRSYVRHLGFKYIEITGPLGRKMAPRPPFAQLYDLTGDPGETRNLIESQPDLARRYERWLADRFRRRSGANAEPDRDALPELLRERLRSLGYVK